MSHDAPKLQHCFLGKRLYALVQSICKDSRTVEEPPAEERGESTRPQQLAGETVFDALEAV
jgi:hypothetical protein